METVDPLPLYIKHNFEEAHTAYKEKCEYFYSCGHRGTGARSEAWAHLFGACVHMSKNLLDEALALVGFTSSHFKSTDSFPQLTPSLALFQSLQPADPDGKKLCEARLAEVRGLLALKEKQYWETRRWLVFYSLENIILRDQKCVIEVFFVFCRFVVDFFTVGIKNAEIDNSNRSKRRRCMWRKEIA